MTKPDYERARRGGRRRRRKREGGGRGGEKEKERKKKEKLKYLPILSSPITLCAKMQDLVNTKD